MFPFGHAQQFILLIGDEGAILLRMSGTTVRARCFAPSPAAADRVEMEEMLAEAPRLPLLLLVDVLEQSFVKESIPPVGMLDEAGVLQRKLRTTFPDARLRGAKYLGRDTRSTRRDKQFLFVAVPETKLIGAWLEWARDVRNPVRAIALLPLESLELATRLSDAFHDKADRPDWIVLVTRHRTGGFRQIVVRKGELVFSRLTQSVAPDASAADIAATLDREHKLTMGYLRRMSFNEEQGLDVIVVAQPEVGDELLKLGMPPQQLRVVTPWEVAESLKLKGVADPNDSYGEILHAAWLATRRKPVLGLMPDELLHHRVALLTARAGYALTVAVVAYLSFGLVDAFLVSREIGDQADVLAAQSAERTDELNHAIQIRGGYTVSAPQVSDTIDLFDRLQSESPSPMPMLAVLASRLGQDLRTDRLVWSVDRSSNTVQARLVLTVEILGAEGNVEVAMAASDGLAAQISELFPDLDVEVTGPPVDILPSQNLVGQVNLTRNVTVTEERQFTTEITIYVPVYGMAEVQP